MKVLVYQDWTIQYMFLVLTVVNSWWHHWWFLDNSTCLYIGNWLYKLSVEHAISWHLWVHRWVPHLLTAKPISMPASANFLSTWPKLKLSLCFSLFFLLLLLQDPIFLIDDTLFLFYILEEVFVLGECHVIWEYFWEFLIKFIHLRQTLNWL